MRVLRPLVFNVDGSAGQVCSLPADTLLVTLGDDEESIRREASPDERRGLLEYVANRLQADEVLARWGSRIRVLRLRVEVELVDTGTPRPTTTGAREAPAWTVRHDF